MNYETVIDIFATYFNALMTSLRIKNYFLNFGSRPVSLRLNVCISVCMFSLILLLVCWPVCLLDFLIIAVLLWTVCPCLYFG